jgi:hypothetical protein
MTPREKSSGVVDALAVQTSPPLLNTTTSVNVPPVSTPMMYCFFAAMKALPVDILQIEIWEGSWDVKAEGSVWWRS